MFSSPSGGRCIGRRAICVEECIDVVTCLGGPCRLLQRGEPSWPLSCSPPWFPPYSMSSWWIDLGGEQNIQAVHSPELHMPPVECGLGNADLRLVNRKCHGNKERRVDLPPTKTQLSMLRIDLL